MQKMNKIKKFLIIFLGLLLPCTASFGQELTEDEVGQVLRKMITARTQYRYMGDVMVKMGMGKEPKIYKKKIWVEPPDRMREEIFLQDTNKKIIRILNNDVFETNADGRSFFSTRRKHSMHRLRTLTRMRRNFDISVSNDTMIAGRETRLILITPKIKSGRKVKNWIDKETGVTLRKEIFRSFGEELTPLFEMHFSNIDYDPPENPDLFRVKEKRHHPQGMKTIEFATIEEAKKSIRMPFLAPDYIPDGYQLDRMRVTRERKNVTVHMNYNNGINSFSIFQTRGPVPPYFRKIFMKKSEDNTIEILRENRTILFRKMGPINLTLIGNCQKEVIKPVLDSFSPPKWDREYRK